MSWRMGEYWIFAQPNLLALPQPNISKRKIFFIFISSLSRNVQPLFHRKLFTPFYKTNYENLCDFTSLIGLLARHTSNLSSFNYSSNFLRLTMNGINEVTIIASLAIPAGMFIGFSKILLNRLSQCI